MTRGSRPNLRAWAFLALAWFVFDALSPALAALAGNRAKSHFVEICSLEGLKRVAVSDDPAAPGAPNELAFKCPVCTHAGAPAAIDAPAAPSWHGETACEAAPRESLRPPATAHPPRAAPPRGPPLHA